MFKETNEDGNVEPGRPGGICRLPKDAHFRLPQPSGTLKNVAALAKRLQKSESWRELDYGNKEC